jgi:ribulose 1,5-bisphosphate carboxylase large subunit-like protein
MLRSDIYKTYVAYTRFNGRQPMRNTGTTGFQTLIIPHLVKALGDDYILHSGGLIYITGLELTPFFLKEIAPL